MQGIVTGKLSILKKKCRIILSLGGCNELNMAMMMSHAEWNSENLIVLFIIMPQFFFNIPSMLFS